MRIIAIVVLYNSEGAKVVENLKKIALQVDTLCLIDNSSISNDSICKEIPQALYMPQFKNKGIAAAQNVGIKYALENKFDYVLFSDPDSSIPGLAVETLLNKFQKLTLAGFNVGAVGSTAYSETTNLPYHINDCFVQKIMEQNVTEVTYTMYSISLISLDLFRKIGLMDESLFIDGVDDEWCWRATHLEGCRFFLDDEVIIKHNLGRSGGKIGKRTISISSPKRLYYEYRNYLWLRRRNYVPRHWVKYNGWKYIVKLFFYPLFVTPRFENLKNIIKGLRDGFRIDNNMAKY